ncbi:MAG: type II 3-dehydroquinate dehydratase [Gammaproteobacteria bacterium RIFCSPLOWO2_02_FULL_42_14]|nr:MAG: type II 3-dehydroquinate dehydratase [Gammaproteobacteria bacterium RIFCSPHIGHO2_02_FULL_42_43]OGT28040.1 MAG: type II 3-dehydroquinate dehydratase [Gammaproteobacteria bacterium RIFCSPHIGHO2_01_FULL_42_8]OGT51693.1 MAG: type II 3-dehydroquinate dehydratase [Gammaproteobacteria bacterium RIFCSPHIGHO2_12_FULL_41_25]OGT61590.1 MAG: type II 3-dehydroquinate dehydratase [Gammaproteobacteria bacterium RIFCSPLOWO2_02_FULL_42_14]OGT86214.1 MAG: type II 3-dehydroquinate dehydratase [Gammaproteo
MAKILTIHGPNLNLLGTREPKVYGYERLEDINKLLLEQARELGHLLISFQSNAEHELIARIHQALYEQMDMILINPAAFTHTSIALRDALLSVKIPCIEIHLSNIFARESFRHHSFFSDIAVGVITGFSANSYRLALLAAHDYLAKQGVSAWTREKLES